MSRDKIIRISLGRVGNKVVTTIGPEDWEGREHS